MDKNRFDAVYRNFATKPTRELRKILETKNPGEWSEEAIEAASRLLAERPDEPLEDTVSIEVPASERTPGVFALSEDDVIGYRRKIQGLGWIYCLVGIGIILFPTVSWYSDGIANVAVIVFTGIALLLGLVWIAVGWGLVKLDPNSRSPGIWLAFVLLLFVPVGTVIGLVGLNWLWKRGHVLGPLAEDLK